MPTPNYDLFREAIVKKKQITCVHNGYRREICPHTLGYSAQGEEQALSFQFAGESSSKLPPGGDWRCMRLADVKDVKLRDGAWHTADNHSRNQTCVKQVEYEVEFA